MSLISILFTVSFGALLVLGTLLMAIPSANFLLGTILFSLGLLLMLGNEYLIFKRQSRKGYGRALPPGQLMAGLLNFAIAAYIFPSAIALFMYFAYGWDQRVLSVVIAGFIVTSVKVAARTAELFFAK
ncbi:Uncharacterised protein [uncultured archaeon]|nr:Uncharacterised protein [uncultured archaeon]